MAAKQEAKEKKLWEQLPIWTILTNEQKEFLLENSFVQHFRKNEIIKCEGEKPTHMMALLKGKVKVYKDGVGTRSQIIRMLKPFENFGYRAVITDEIYNTSVCAFEVSEVFMIKKEAFLKLLRTNSEFCYLFLVALATDLGDSDTRSVNLTQKHIRGRLSEALLSLQKSYGYEEDGATINMYMSREDLANLSNMTTSNAIRTLSNFSSENIISIDGRKIKILDEERLIKISRIG